MIQSFTKSVHTSHTFLMCPWSLRSSGRSIAMSADVQIRETTFAASVSASRRVCYRFIFKTRTVTRNMRLSQLPRRAVTVEMLLYLYRNWLSHPSGFFPHLFFR